MELTGSLSGNLEPALRGLLDYVIADAALKSQCAAKLIAVGAVTVDLVANELAAEEAVCTPPFKSVHFRALIRLAQGKGWAIAWPSKETDAAENFSAPFCVISPVPSTHLCWVSPQSATLANVMPLLSSVWTSFEHPVLVPPSPLWPGVTETSLCFVVSAGDELATQLDRICDGRDAAVGSAKLRASSVLRSVNCVEFSLGISLEKGCSLKTLRLICPTLAIVSVREESVDMFGSRRDFERCVSLASSNALPLLLGCSVTSPPCIVRQIGIVDLYVSEPANFSAGKKQPASHDSPLAARRASGFVTPASLYVVPPLRTPDCVVTPNFPMESPLHSLLGRDATLAPFDVWTPRPSTTPLTTLLMSPSLSLAERELPACSPHVSRLWGEEEAPPAQHRLVPPEVDVVLASAAHLKTPDRSRSSIPLPALIPANRASSTAHLQSITLDIHEQHTQHTAQQHTERQDTAQQCTTQHTAHSTAPQRYTTSKHTAQQQQDTVENVAPLQVAQPSAAPQEPPQPPLERHPIDALLAMQKAVCDTPRAVDAAPPRTSKRDGPPSKPVLYRDLHAAKCRDLSHQFVAHDVRSNYPAPRNVILRAVANTVQFESNTEGTVRTHVFNVDKTLPNNLTHLDFKTSRGIGKVVGKSDRNARGIYDVTVPDLSSPKTSAATLVARFVGPRLLVFENTKCGCLAEKSVTALMGLRCKRGGECLRKQNVLRYSTTSSGRCVLCTCPEGVWMCRVCRDITCNDCAWDERGDRSIESSEPPRKKQAVNVPLSFSGMTADDVLECLVSVTGLARNGCALISQITAAMLPGGQSSPVIVPPSTKMNVAVAFSKVASYDATRLKEALDMPRDLRDGPFHAKKSPKEALQTILRDATCATRDKLFHAHADPSADPPDTVLKISLAWVAGLLDAWKMDDGFGARVFNAQSDFLLLIGFLQYVLELVQKAGTVAFDVVQVLMSLSHLCCVLAVGWRVAWERSTLTSQAPIYSRFPELEGVRSLALQAGDRAWASAVAKPWDPSPLDSALRRSIEQMNSCAQ